MIPLYGFLEGDTIGLLVLAEGDDRSPSSRASCRRRRGCARAIDGPVTVLYNGEPLDRSRTVSDAGMRPLGALRRAPGAAGVSFRRVADVASLWPGEMKGLVVDTTKVLLVNVGGDVRAYEDSCPHRGVALSCGKLEAASGTLTCAMHLWQYDARTGKGVNPRGVGLRRLPMKLEDDGIWVEVDGDAAAE